MKRRRKLRSTDRYPDPDTLEDGETQHTPHYLADSRMTFVPATMQRPPRAIHYGRGYVRDAGTAAPVRDASAAAYYAMKDSLGTEYLRHGPKRDACCSGCAHDQQFPEREYPHNGGVSNSQQWPDPFRLQSQHAGDQCMTDDKRAGTLRRGRNGDLVCDLVCVANRRDGAEVMAVGEGPYPLNMAYAVGQECRLASGELGLLCREDDRLVCRARDYDDAQSVRDRAYNDMVERQRNAWRSW
jgi:hypothetical protein